jgi:rod shape-determining protein MreC
MQSAAERRPTLLLILVLGALFIVMSSSSRTRRTPDDRTLLGRAAMAILSPIPKGVDDTFSWMRDIWNGYVDLRQAAEENSMLKRRLARLAAENVQLRGASGEVSRMRELLGYAESLQTPAVFGRIVMVDTAGPFKSIVVDRGAAHGVHINDPVVNSEGLIGRVVLTTSDVCKVQLIVDSGSSVGISLERTRRQAIAKGIGTMDLDVAFVPVKADVQVGDRIITGGIDGIYPKGIVVGTIQSVAEGPDLFAQVAAEPAVDFATMEDVIILSTPKLDPDVARYVP